MQKGHIMAQAPKKRDAEALRLPASQPPKPVTGNVLPATLTNLTSTTVGDQKTVRAGDQKSGSKRKYSAAHKEWKSHSKAVTYTPEQMITVISEGNPKRSTGKAKSWARFNLYTRPTMSVGAYIKAQEEAAPRGIDASKAKALQDIHWDVTHNFISVK